jgi:meiotically up-regulated gene 157 (Mug157) protein
VTFDNISKLLKNYLSFKNKSNIKNRGLLNNTEAFYLRIKKIMDDLINISKSVRSSIYENGVFEDPKSGEKYFAYEVDCYGNHYFMDDPGYPSLISLSFFGFVDSTDPLYVGTRKRVLSNRNPYYYKGSLGDGLGSSHTSRNFIWPLFTIMRIITSNDEQEIMTSIDLLLKSANATGYIHESFNINDVSQYTRSWFAWANSFFGYMINHVIKTRPHLLLNN